MSFKPGQKSLFLEVLISPDQISLSLCHLVLPDIFGASLLLSLMILLPH